MVFKDVNISECFNATCALSHPWAEERSWIFEMRTCPRRITVRQYQAEGMKRKDGDKGKAIGELCCCAAVWRTLTVFNRNFNWEAYTWLRFKGGRTWGYADLWIATNSSRAHGLEASAFWNNSTWPKTSPLGRAARISRGNSISSSLNFYTVTENALSLLTGFNEK